MSGYLHKNDSSLISIRTKLSETKNLYLYFHELGSTNANLHLQKTLLFVGFCRVLSGFRKPTKPDVKN